MQYKLIYDKLINNAKKRINPSNIYIEIHHIIPQSVGGTNNISNLVELTLREHYFAHELLVRIYPESNELKYALWMMTVTTKSAIENHRCHRGRRISDLYKYDKEITISCNQYEYAKEQYILGKSTKRYSKEEKERVSKGTVKGMMSENAIRSCNKGSKDTKWYRDKSTGKTYKWHKGDPNIDLNIYEWGRGKFFTKEQKEKVSKGQKYPKTFYKINNTDILVSYPDDAIKSVPDNFIKTTMSIVNGKSIHRELMKYLREFHIQTNFKYNRSLSIYQNRRDAYHKNRISPAVYEILVENGIKSISDLSNKIVDILKENIDIIIKRNKKYLKFKEY